jgi:predicted protein tyrosine phosphatase
MIEVIPGLFVGTQLDWTDTVHGGDNHPKKGWSVVHACKEPHHREALRYSSRGAPRDDPEYLIARRDNRLILNLIDADDVRYVPKEIIDAALEFIGIELSRGQKVLVHCNQGASRAPAIALTYMSTIGRLPSDYAEALTAFKALYPPYAPAQGIADFTSMNWGDYQAEKEPMAWPGPSTRL